MDKLPEKVFDGLVEFIKVYLNLLETPFNP